MIRFSVIIPHYNDGERLLACLRSLTRLEDGLRQVEVIVVDDASPLDVEPRVRETLPTAIWFRQPANRGPGAARNAGIAQARGEFLAFVDCDAQVGTGWLAAFDRAFAQGAEVVCGQVRHRQTLLAQLTALTAFGDFLDIEDGVKPNFPSVNFAIRASLMRAFPFDETVRFAGEDSIVSRQLVRAGHAIRYSAAAWVIHDPHLSPAAFNARAYRYGLGFRESRVRDPLLPGAILHRTIGPASAIVLLPVRLALDLRRLVRHWRVLGTAWQQVPAMLAGIVWVRLLWAVGVAAAYVGGGRP